MAKQPKTVQEQVQEVITELDLETDTPIIEPASDDRFSLVGEHISISLRSDLADDGFLITGLLRGIMGNLDYSRINSMELFNDLERQAAQAGHNGEPRGLSDAQQIFADNLYQQLYNVADVSEDLETFWDQVNDNINLSIHPRTDAAILFSIQQAKARKEEERLAKLHRMQTAGVENDRTDLAARRMAILTRFNNK